MGLILCVAIVLYFRMGVHIAPLTTAPHAAATADSVP